MSILQTSLLQFRQYKDLAEGAMQQISDEDLLLPAEHEENSLVVLIKHLHGNMLSRFTNFLEEDGEKPWRQRDKEFEHEAMDRLQAMQLWEAGWACVLDNIGVLKDEDLTRIIHIRTEPMTVEAAILRQLMHYAYHVGQIVWYCKQKAGSAWQSLSIPKGGSAEYNEQLKKKP